MACTSLRQICFNNSLDSNKQTPDTCYTSAIFCSTMKW